MVEKFDYIIPLTRSDRRGPPRNPTIGLGLLESHSPSSIDYTVADVFLCVPSNSRLLTLVQVHPLSSDLNLPPEIQKESYFLFQKSYEQTDRAVFQLLNSDTLTLFKSLRDSKGRVSMYNLIPENYEDVLRLLPQIGGQRCQR